MLTADSWHVCVGQGCPVPIALGEVRMQRRVRMPQGRVMIQQYWHLRCFQGWATLPRPLPGIEQLRLVDQVINCFYLPSAPQNWKQRV